MPDHADAPVDVLDPALAIDGSKPRRDIDKQSDRYHTVFVQVVLPGGHLVLARVPHRTDLANSWPDRWGLTAATIRRTGETVRDAARRVVAAELSGAGGDLEELGTYPAVDGGVDRLHTVFRLAALAVPDYSRTDIAGITIAAPTTVGQIIADPDAATPSLAQAWHRFGHVIR